MLRYTDLSTYLPYPCFATFFLHQKNAGIRNTSANSHAMGWARQVPANPIICTTTVAARIRAIISMIPDKMANTEKTAVEIEWILDVPVREDIYEYIVNS